MAWTPLGTNDVTVGALVNAASMNSYASNLRYLKGMDGAVVLEDSVSIGATGTAKSLIVYGDASGNAQGPITAKNTSAGITGTALTLDASGATGGRIWSLLSAAAGVTAAGGLAWFDSTASAYRMLLDASGNLGIGTIQPKGTLHVVGAVGRAIYWDYDGLSGTARSVLPAGGFSGGVIYSILCKAASTTAVLTNNVYSLSPAPPTSIQINGANPSDFRIYFNADGSIDVRRSSGTDTAKVSMILRCL